MDLAIGAKQVFVMMTLFDKKGRSKLVPECTYPLTGVDCVGRVYTDVAVIDVGPDGASVRETFGVTLDELRDRLPVPSRRPDTRSQQHGLSGTSPSSRRASPRRAAPA